MKFGVVVFPGSNCDRDMIHVLQHVMKQEVEVLWHKDHSLKGCDFIVLPGGFSYGDYLRSGAIARFSPVMNEVMEFADKGGYVMGICNGFQILCEAGLLPGTLLHNVHHKFVCKNVYIKAEHNHSLITAILDPAKPLKIPVAHGEGNYYIEEKSMQDLETNGQVLFRYCDEHGHVNEASSPNGALKNIAGICNVNKNVFGMMPHPERAAIDELGNTDGRIIFESLLTLVDA